MIDSSVTKGREAALELGELARVRQYEDHTQVGGGEWQFESAQMDDAGIAWSVLLLPDFTFALNDCPMDIEAMFKLHAGILARHPERFVVLAGVDPRWGSDGIALFERGIRDFGFRGLKLCTKQAAVRIGWVDPSRFVIRRLEFIGLSLNTQVQIAE